MENVESQHKAGFVTIIGNPNAGKSTLLNCLLSNKLVIVNPKPQTTRHRILCIENGDEFQIVYTDTPGFISPKYELQRCMMRKLYGTLTGADIIIWVVDGREEYFENDLEKRILKQNTPIILLINKIDLLGAKDLAKVTDYWASRVNVSSIIPISAINKLGVQLVIENIVKNLPLNPPYYPKDMITDRSERFFASEIIREQILNYYDEEIPYSVEVTIDEFIDSEDIIRIKAILNVEHQSQKAILIGKNGSALKNVGTAARKDLESFFNKKIFLEQHVKLAENWRKEPLYLKKVGYM